MTITTSVGVINHGGFAMLTTNQAYDTIQHKVAGTPHIVQVGVYYDMQPGDQFATVTLDMGELSTDLTATEARNLAKALNKYADHLEATLAS